MEFVLNRTALLLSYVWEALVLPIHSARLAALRLSSRRVQYELSLALEREYVAFKQDVARIIRMERELASANLALVASRRAAAEAFQARLNLLRKHIREIDQPEGQDS